MIAHDCPKRAMSRDLIQSVVVGFACVAVAALSASCVLDHLVTALILAYALLPSPLQIFIDKCYLLSASFQSIFAFRFYKPGHINFLKYRVLLDSPESIAVALEDLHSLAIAQAGVHITVHEVTTVDGYILRLFRCRSVKDSCSSPSENNINSLSPQSAKETWDTTRTGDPSQVPVILFHGLLQDSRSFLVGGSKYSLASHLAHRHHDIWLCNSRGSKYSQQHVHLSVHNEQYWQFGLDHLAEYDVSATIDYIQQHTGATKTICVGFSQGSAQLFASLSLPEDQPHPIKSSCALFIALAPAARVVGFQPSLLSRLIDWQPKLLLQWALGRKHVDFSVCTTQGILSKKTYAKMISATMRYMFGWTSDNISPVRRRDLFEYIFSTSSVMLVHHWFQILTQKGVLAKYSHKAVSSESYDLSQIKVPIAVISGGNDRLIDARRLHRELINSNCVHFQEIPTYEHLDLLWADDASSRVFPVVSQLIDNAIKKVHEKQ